MQQYISLNELRKKPKKTYRLRPLSSCVCGCSKRRQVDTTPVDGEHTYQYICIKCGRASMSMPSKTMAVDSWNKMQKQEKEKLGGK